MTKIKGFAIAKFLPLMRLTFLWLFLFKVKTKIDQEKGNPQQCQNFCTFGSFLRMVSAINT